MKLHLPKTLRYRIYLYIVSILLILTATDLTLVRIGRHITIGYDTTRITAPRKPDGMPDYLKVIDDAYSAGVTPENNAAPLLLAAIGPEALPRTSAETIYSRLAMPALPQTGDYFTPYSKYKDRGTTLDPSNADTQEQAAKNHLWRRADNPRLAAWLDSQSHPLSLFHEAAGRPRFYIPVTTSARHPGIVQGIVFPPFEPLDGMAYAAITRAMLRAGEGDFAAARSDLLDAHRFSRLVAQGPTPDEFWMGQRLDERACESERALASSGSLTAAQAQSLIADLAALLPFPDLAAKLDAFARYSVLDGVVASSAKRASVVLDEPRAWRRLVVDYTPSNFNEALRRANSLSDATVEACRTPIFAQRLARVDATDRMLREFSEHVHASSYLDPADSFLVSCLSGSQLSEFSPISRDWHDTWFDLTRLALALAAYHAEHGIYPRSLAALAPDYLPTIPSDLFIDQPFHYHTTPTGYLLYSVDLNMTDDGGHGWDHKDPANPHADDLAVLVGEFPATRPK